MSLVPLAGLAQNGLIERTLGNQLSAEGRIVEITGLAGALSARASVEELTVADRDGVWLTLTDAVFDWDRAALFSGRLNIETLSAKRLTMVRTPAQSGAPFDLWAGGLSVPNLPVALNIGDLRIDTLTLGPSILGEAAVLDLAAALTLEDGVLDTTFTARRLDGSEGSLTLDLAIESQSQLVSIDLDAREPAGGLIARALSLPGLPSLSLTAKGSGPLDSFSAHIALATDGKNRLAGDVSLRSVKGGRRFDIDIAGDLRALVDPQTGAVLGPRSALVANGRANEDGTFSLDQFDLSTGTLRLAGEAMIGPGGWPRRIAAEGSFFGALPGRAGGSVGTTNLRIAFDAAVSPIWQFSAIVQNFDHPAGSADEIALTGRGVIEPTSAVPFSGAISFAAQGFGLTHQGLLDAIGSQPQVTTDLVVSQNGQTQFQDLTATIAAGALTGDLALAFDDGQVIVDSQLDLASQDLAPLSRLLGRPMAGQAVLTTGTNLQIPAGVATVQLSGEILGLSAGIGAAEPLIAPRTYIDARLSRDLGGITIEAARLENTQIQATAAGRLGPPDGAVRLDARLTDLGTLVPAVPGAVRADITLTGLDRVSAQIVSATGLGLQATGRLNAPDGLALSMSGTAPLALVQVFAPKQSITGQASFDLAINGAPLRSNLKGDVQVSNARIADPNQGVAIEDVNGAIAIADGIARIALRGGSGGGRVQATGPVTLSAPYPMDLQINLSDVMYRFTDVVQTTANGQISLGGDAFNRLVVGGQLDLTDSTVRLPDRGLSGAAAIPEITHIDAPGPVMRSLARAGLIQRAPRSTRLRLPLDLTITTNTPIFVQGGGLDASFAGSLHVKGQVGAPEPAGQFNLTRGRLDVLGQGLDLTQGTITLSGDLIPDLRVAATTQTGDVTVEVALQGRADALEIALSSSPDLPESEILSQLIFGRSSGSLSALQIAKIVNVVSGLSSDRSLFARLRDGLGVDDLDLRTNEDGDAELALGNRINSELYSEVELTDGGNIGITLNFDLNDNTTIRGSADNSGSSGIGVFWQKDY